jgi:ribonuclease HI/probable phosphoglycerate mutase
MPEQNSRSEGLDYIGRVHGATLRFDGGGQAPGPISGGVVLELDWIDDPVEDTFFAPEGTHNEAEYRALILGLDKAREYGVTHLTIYGDSRLIVEQVNERYRVRKVNLLPLHALAMDHLSAFEEWELTHVRRQENTRADALASAALKRGE